MLTYRFPVYSLIVLALVALTACAMPPGSYSRTTINGVEKVYRYGEGF